MQRAVYGRSSGTKGKRTDADYSEEMQKALYVYRNDCGFNTFMQSKIRKISHSSQSLEIHAADSTYSIPYSAIDMLNDRVAYDALKDNKFSLNIKADLSASLRCNILGSGKEFSLQSVSVGFPVKEWYYLPLFTEPACRKPDEEEPEAGTSCTSLPDHLGEFSLSGIVHGDVDL